MVDAPLARELVDERFPEWAELPLRPIEPGGWDHRSFRLGDELVVRIPSAIGYVPQVAKEQAWLPRLAAALPLPIPTVAGAGEPTARFPHPWSVYAWIAGDTLARTPIDDEVAFAGDLAAFLVALRRADAAGAPPPGLHSGHRGSPVSHWQAEVEAMLPRIGDARRRDRAAALWRDALAEPYRDEPVWVHGDVSTTNLLVRDGRLAAVIDFGCAAVGDPACDTVIAWTRFAGDARDAFMRGLEVDEGTWARGRGWALWKALTLLDSPDPAQLAFAQRTIDVLTGFDAHVAAAPRAAASGRAPHPLGLTPPTS